MPTFEPGLHRVTLEQSIDTDIVADDGEPVLIEKPGQVIATERRFQRAETLHDADQLCFRRRTRRWSIAFKDEERTAISRGLGQIGWPENEI